MRIEDSGMENTKDRLLRAAISVFSQKGYKASTVREICQRAGAANLSSVVYYFGGKENLYRAALEFMFEDAKKFQPSPLEIQAIADSAEERLALFIRTFVRVFFAVESNIDSELASLFAKEMTNPSPFLGEMVERYLVPANEMLHGIIQDIIGKNAPLEVIRDCGFSVWGQIYYHVLVWPSLRRAYPDCRGVEERLEDFAGHVTRFTLGGLREVKRAFRKANITEDNS